MNAHSTHHSCGCSSENCPPATVAPDVHQLSGLGRIESADAAMSVVLGATSIGSRTVNLIVKGADDTGRLLEVNRVTATQFPDESFALETSKVSAQALELGNGGGVSFGGGRTVEDQPWSVQALDREGGPALRIGLGKARTGSFAVTSSTGNPRVTVDARGNTILYGDIEVGGATSSAPVEPDLNQSDFRFWVANAYLTGLVQCLRATG